MKLKIIVFLLVSFWSFSQNRPIEIIIDSITSIDSKEFREREFTIVYHIKNLSDKEVTFFLNPNKFIPSTASSMQYVPTYRLFQNENPFDVYQEFSRNRTIIKLDATSSKSLEEYNKKYVDSIMSESEKMRSDTLYAWNNKNKEIMNSIFVLKPNETKQFVEKINWNKVRYAKSHDLEYYIDVDSKYYLQLELTLMKSEFQDRLTTNELETIMKNPNFLKGNFYSNKIELNFKE